MSTIPAAGESPQPSSRSSSLSYQDLLRAIGRVLDQEQWAEVSLVERDSAIFLRGTRPGPQGREPVMLRLGASDLAHVLRAARSQRGQGRLVRPQTSRLGALQQQHSVPPLTTWLEGGTYQARLRAIGWLSDTSGLRALRLVEDDGDFILEGRRARGVTATPSRLTAQDFRRLLQKLTGLRATKPATGQLAAS